MKHFLDTSVLRPLLTSPPKVKCYYKIKLTGEKYYCSYIKMEFLRGFISSCINFYFLLSMPQYDTVADVLHVWSNKFQIREHKNIEIMISNLLQHNDCKNDKEIFRKTLADYIRRLVGKLHLCFKDIGTDGTHCTKGLKRIKFDPCFIDNSLREFSDTLNNNYEYNQCKINQFIKQTKSEEFKKIINYKHIDNHEKSDGFKKMVDNLNKIKLEKDITCAFCSKIGDAVIAVLCLPNFTLEHTDYSFNYLCEILEKDHQHHPYDVKLLDMEI